MARRTRRHADKRRDRRRLGWYLMAGSVAVVLLAVIAMVVWSGPEVDRETGCPVSHDAPPAHTIVLVDQTDTLPPNELRFARDLIYNEYFWLPVEGKLTILNITSDGIGDVTPIVVCRMPDSEEVNPFMHTPEAVRRNFERRAGARLSEFLDRMIRMGPQEQSPIVESIAAVFQRTDFGADIDLRRLVILSDMAQNSPRYTDYGRGPAFNADSVDRRFKPDMSGTAIRVQYVMRDTLAFQGDRHKERWEAYLNAAGSRDVSIGHGLQLGEPRERRVWYNTGGRR